MGLFGTLWSGILSAGSGISDTAAALGAFFTTVTDYRMWRSLAWLILGVLLIAAGLALLAKDTVVGGVVGSAVKS